MIWKQSLKGQLNYLDIKAAANLRYLRMPQRQSKFQPRRSAPQPVQPRRSGPQPVLAAELDPQPVLAAALEPQPVLAAALEPQSVLAAALEPQPFLAAALEPQPFLASLSHSTHWHGKSSARIYFQKLVIPGHLSVQCTQLIIIYFFMCSVHRIIGRGGFGEVYGCRKADTGKMYAMKVIFNFFFVLLDL